MALEPTWQVNYVDLSDERTIRFGAWCVVCGARYVSPDEPLDPALPHAPSPGSAAARAVEAAKYRTFVEFDAAFREITIGCYGCTQPACPDCWDEDNGMCGACVQMHGLQRSPHRGVHAAPLADGRLRRMEPGQFSEAARPGWLNELLAAQMPEMPAGGQPGASDAMWQGLSAIAPGQSPAPEPKVERPASVFVPMPSTQGSFVTEPTKRITTATSTPPAPPTPAPMSALNGSGMNVRSGAVGRVDIGEYASPEGKATSNMVECPRCHTANYDFVTRCTVCQLQLIQICPLCERLNPGHAKFCEGCGSPLDRPSGWSEVRAQVIPLSANEAHRPQEYAPSPAKPPRRTRLTRPKRVDSAKIPAPNGWEQPEPGEIPLAAVTAVAPSAPSPSVAAPASDAMAMTAQPSQPEARALPPESDGGMWNAVLVTLERITTTVLLLTILALVGAIVAAELSAGVDAAIKSMIHVDIREAMANFWSWLQTLWHRYQYHT